jgi:hypothetical protein
MVASGANQLSEADIGNEAKLAMRPPEARALRLQKQLSDRYHVARHLAAMVVAP